MIIRIDFESSIPLYSQLRDQVLQGMARGELKEGEGLPSVRQMAQDLGINLHTVNKAYQLLRDQGFVTIHRQRGVTIGRFREIQSQSRDTSPCKDPWTTLLAEAHCRGMKEKEIIQMCREILRDFQELPTEEE